MLSNLVRKKFFRMPDCGFTLIELLVVIAIVAIMAAILFPVLLSTRNQARQARCLANMRQLGTAFELYIRDWDDTMPATAAFGLPNWSGCEGPELWVYPEKGQIWRYIRNKSLYLCPLDRGHPTQRIQPSAIPVGLTAKDYPLSYSMNIYLSKKKVGTLRMRQVSRMLLLIQEDRTRFNDDIYVPNPGDRDIPGKIHDGGTNILYLDGHALWRDRDVLRAERDSQYWIPIGVPHI